MKLARIVKWDNCPWRLNDGGAINPPIGTIVQYEELPRGKCGDYWRRVYFPGYASHMTISMIAFNRYFEDFFDEIS